MARNDGIDRTCARNADVTDTDIGDTQAHNERENESYSNDDIIPERSHLNVHYKHPAGSYAETFQRMEQEKVISTRGLKADAIHFNEMVLDVNSAYFHNHGGYEYAKQFYADAYKAAVDIIGREQFVISAVMHADEINRSMTDALGQEVYHYHLHVVYVPVVEKQILWSKRCKAPALVGTVKETIMQVSCSKKWISKPALDEQGNPMKSKTDKTILKRSYSILQDDFFNAIRAAGYTDVERGEKDSTEDPLTVTQFKVMKEQERLANITAQREQSEQALASTTAAAEKQEQRLKSLQAKTKTVKAEGMIPMEIEAMGKKTLTGNITMTTQECRMLKDYAISSFAEKSEKLKYKKQYEEVAREAGIWKKKYLNLKEKAQHYLDALEIASERVQAFLSAILARGKEQPEHKPATRKRGRDMEL